MTTSRSSTCGRSACAICRRPCIGADYLEFAISTFGRRAHPNYPAEFDLYIDNNNDGAPDYVVFNAENGGFSVTGQNLVFVANLTTGPATAVFFTDADLNSGNVIFTVPMNGAAGPSTSACSQGRRSASRSTRSTTTSPVR